MLLPQDGDGSDSGSAAAVASPELKPYVAQPVSKKQESKSRTDFAG